MMVIFLVGLVSMIMMRTLRKDYARYSRDDELDDLVSKPCRMHMLMYVAVYTYMYLSKGYLWKL